MQVTPQGQPQGAPAPQAQAQPAGQASGPAEQAVQMVSQGFQILGKMIQSSGPNVPPDMIKLFQNAVQATDAFLQVLTSPQGQGGPQNEAPEPKGPMAPNANMKSRPAGPQGR